MGQNQSQSQRTFSKLRSIMPPVNRDGDDNPLTGWLDKSAKPFISDEDRKQFIYATISVITQNGSLDLSDHDFRLLYSRRNADRLVARLVAEQDGVIKTQVVANDDGKTQIEAFLALRRHVETELDGILSGLPHASAVRSTTDGAAGSRDGPNASTRSSASASASPSTAEARQATMARPDGNGVPSDAPPAYGKAVKEWKTDEKKR